MSERTYTLRTEEIHRLRAERGLTVRELAKKADVDVKTLQRWLKGKPAFLAGAYAVAKALDTSVQNLLDGFRPKYAGVSAAPEAAFRMTFSVELDNAPTPEQIKELCDLLDQAVIAFRERPWNSPNAKLRYLGKGFEIPDLHLGMHGLPDRALPIDPESQRSKLEPPEPKATSHRDWPRYVGAIEEAGYVLYHVSHEPNLDSLLDIFAWAVVVEVAEGGTDPGRVAELTRLYAAD